jgi:hypothetical protein
MNRFTHDYMSRQSPETAADVLDREMSVAWLSRGAQMHGHVVWLYTDALGSCSSCQGQLAGHNCTQMSLGLGINCLICAQGQGLYSIDSIAC